MNIWLSSGVWHSEPVRGLTWAGADSGWAEVEAVPWDGGDPALVDLDKAFDELKDSIAVDGLLDAIRTKVDEGNDRTLTGSAKRAIERSRRRMFISGRKRRALPSGPRYA